jgi:hypothetical protein
MSIPYGRAIGGPDTKLPERAPPFKRRAGVQN